ncbi:MAG: glutaredoxin family protein [Candidatus Bathyarchaeota archaeon]|nr:MAG: glutaredoxin family protein [Candidatus Bathyarchaeota archaeon]
MKSNKVPGRNRKHRVLLYAISTCGWCKRTKDFLKDNDIEFKYVDVDLCSEEDREEIKKDILKRGGRLSYPTIIVDDDVIINGFHDDMIKEALGI